VKTTFQAEEQIFNDLMVLSKDCAAYHPDIIVWPETMVQATMNPETRGHLNTADMSERFHRALSHHAQQTSAYILIGAYGGRLKLEDNGLITLSRYNSVFLYRPDGSQDPRHYDKMHLVLLGEYIPFRRSCPWLFSLLSQFTPYDHDYSLLPGQHPTVFEMPLPSRGPNEPLVSPPNTSYHFGTMICYEDTVPDIARQFILDKQGHKRVDWLVNISNDGWFVRFSEDTEKVTPSAELMQHVAVCVFRAVENRVAIIRSVNTGISCMIDSCGRIQRTSLYSSSSMPDSPKRRAGIEGWFIDSIPLDGRVSFFSQYGQWLDILCACSFIVLSLWSTGTCLSKRLRHRP
jgi:apolipoprotein N-acyltransferase